MDADTPLTVELLAWEKGTADNEAMRNYGRALRQLAAITAERNAAVALGKRLAAALEDAWRGRHPCPEGQCPPCDVARAVMAEARAAGWLG